MRISDLRSRRAPALVEAVLPSLAELGKAVSRVTARWPDAVREPDERDRDRLITEFLTRIEAWNWKDVPMGRAVQAGFAAFDAERRDRPEVTPLQQFLLREIAASHPPSFLAGMFSVYVASFEPGAAHTLRLAEALSKRADDMGARTKALLDKVPELLEPGLAPGALARVMMEADDPWQALRDLGFVAPHAPGLLSHAHLAFVRQIAPQLDTTRAQERLLSWLIPDGRTALQANASPAIEALLRPWVNRSPAQDRQSRLTEAIVAGYNDPRIHRGGIWAGFDPELKSVLLRWLAGQDMRFFCDVVTATQDNHMWPPRRNFWLRLFEQKRIDEAWVAFGADAKAHARNLLLRTGTTDVGRRFGTQLDRGGSTTLLIMRIGNKIVVDGCHSYRTHIFPAHHPKAPKLYQMQYHCDDIMRASPASKAHNSIPAWMSWVEQHI